MKPVKSNQNIDDISSQFFGLTDKHIHYFSQDQTQNTKQDASSKVLGIHHKMLSDFQALVASAAEDGIKIVIASGFRSFERQLLIWNNKFIGITAIKNADGERVNINDLKEMEIIEAILLYSALPGASRHHWGCDIDIYAANLLEGQLLQLEPWEYASSGPMAKLTNWLVDNANKHGFYFPYDKFRGGIAAEPWHLSYAPLAKLYQSAFNVDLLKELLLQSDIAGKKVIVENLTEISARFINNVNTAQ
jgi:LAS superfamily LD-carboxypeptidase LdcB